MSDQPRDITDELGAIASEMELEVRTGIRETRLVRFRRIGGWISQNHRRIDLALKAAIVELKATTTIHSPEEWHRPIRSSGPRLPLTLQPHVFREDLREEDEQ